jgi:hypothetical protein
MRGYPTDPAKLRQARELRAENVSLRVIAALTGIPRSTVGEHLRGVGETVAEIHCEWCGAETIAFSAKRQYCTPTCGKRAWCEAHPGRHAAHMRAYHKRRKAAA